MNNNSGTLYGYVRVSTKGQALNGNSLEAQTAALLAAGVDEANIYTDVFTGMKKNRPGLNAVLPLLQAGDTLVVTKLCRFSRSAMAGAQMIEELLDQGVVVHILNMGRMDNTPMGKLVRMTLLAYAEFERDMIVERFEEGKEIARQAPSYREGRKPVAVDPDMFEDVCAQVADKKMTAHAAAKRLGVSRATWYRLIKRSA